MNYSLVDVQHSELYHPYSINILLLGFRGHRGRADRDMVRPSDPPPPPPTPRRPGSPAYGGVQTVKDTFCISTVYSYHSEPKKQKQRRLKNSHNYVLRDLIFRGKYPLNLCAETESSNGNTE